MSNSGGRGTVAGEALTMAPGENGQTCGKSGCHASGAFTPSIEFALNDMDGNPVEKYKAGESYTVRINVATTGSPTAYGFQMVAVSTDENGVGSWGALPSGVQELTLGGRQYVEHSMRLPEPIIEVPWVAPNEDKGDVTFYLSANAVNTSFSPAGDGTANDNFTFSFDGLSSVDTYKIDNFNIFPNPASHHLFIENITNGIVSIFNAQGQLLFSDNYNNNGISLEHLSSGMYFINLEGSNELKRFIKI